MAGILPQLGISSSNPNLAGLSSSTYIGANGQVGSSGSVQAPKAANPNLNVSQSSMTIAPEYQAPANTPSQASIQSASAANPGAFNLLPGETPQAYNSRIAALLAGQGGGQTGSTGGGNLTALPQAPTGYQASAPVSGNNVTQPNNGTAPTGNYTAYTSTGVPITYGTGSPGAPTNQGFLGQLMSNTGNPQYSQDNANLQNLKNQQADLETSIAGGDQPLYFKQGEMGQEQQAYQTKLAAAGQAVQNDINEQNAQTTAASAGATATLPGAQNYQVAPGSTVYNAQNQQVAGGIGGYANYSTAQQVYSLSGQYPDAVNSQGQTFTYDPSQTPQQNVQNFDQNFLPNSPTYQKATYGQPGTNSVAAATELGTSVSGYQQAAQQSNSNIAAYSAANQQGQTVAQLLSSTGLDNAASPYYNQAINTLGAKLGSTNVAQLTTAISELSTMYTNLLGTTGSNTPSGNEAIASSIAALNPNSSAKVIAASLSQLQTAAYAKISAQYNLAQQYAQGLNQGGSTNAGTTGTGTFSDNSFYGTGG